MARHPQSPVPRRDLDRAWRFGLALEAWYVTDGRSFPWRSWSDEYRLAVAEVLLQRTRADVVAAFIGPFLARYPNWDSLGRVPIPTLEMELEPLGLQRRRAASLRALAVDVETNPTRPWSERVGMGQYISRAMAVGLVGARFAMVDSNFIRIIRRAFEGPWRAEYRADPRLQAIAQAIVDGAHDPKVANWAILDLGATVCKPRKPDCPTCPISRLCLTGAAFLAAAEGPFIQDQPNG